MDQLELTTDLDSTIIWSPNFCNIEPTVAGYRIATDPNLQAVWCTDLKFLSAVEKIMPEFVGNIHTRRNLCPNYTFPLGLDGGDIHVLLSQKRGENWKPTGLQSGFSAKDIRWEFLRCVNLAITMMPERSVTWNKANHVSSPQEVTSFFINYDEKYIFARHLTTILTARKWPNIIYFKYSHGFQIELHSGLGKLRQNIARDYNPQRVNSDPRLFFQCHLGLTFYAAKEPVPGGIFVVIQRAKEAFSNRPNAEYILRYNILGSNVGYVSNIKDSTLGANVTYIHIYNTLIHTCRPLVKNLTTTKVLTAGEDLQFVASMKLSNSLVQPNGQPWKRVYEFLKKMQITGAPLRIEIVANYASFTEIVGGLLAIKRQVMTLLRAGDVMDNPILYFCDGVTLREMYLNKLKDAVKSWEAAYISVPQPPTRMSITLLSYWENVSLGLLGGHRKYTSEDPALYNLEAPLPTPLDDKYLTRALVPTPYHVKFIQRLYSFFDDTNSLVEFFSEDARTRLSPLERRLCLALRLVMLIRFADMGVIDYKDNSVRKMHPGNFMKCVEILKMQGFVKNHAIVKGWARYEEASVGFFKSSEFEMQIIRQLCLSHSEIKDNLNRAVLIKVMIKFGIDVFPAKYFLHWDKTRKLAWRRLMDNTTLMKMSRSEVPDDLLERHIRLSNLHQSQRWRKTQQKLDNLQHRFEPSDDFGDENCAADKEIYLRQLAIKKLGDHVDSYNAVMVESIDLFSEEVQRLCEFTLREEAMEALEDHVAEYNERLDALRGIVTSEEIENLRAESEVAFEMAQLNIERPTDDDDVIPEINQQQEFFDATLFDDNFPEESSTRYSEVQHDNRRSCLQQQALIELEGRWDEYQAQLLLVYGPDAASSDVLLDYETPTPAVRSPTMPQRVLPNSDLQVQAASDFDKMWFAYHRLYLAQNADHSSPREDSIRLQVETLDELARRASSWNDEHGLIFDDCNE